ncbi:F0F1 ATP synthase subunit delta [Candidatus Cytomitobacter primus]|uniref:Uncharacterized protein n=1 Tax=Candidatus Cytomitobacter primus TaxID=2066024 RepID=A0A5C0UG29_9PROT|nr:F0F1 ATP synthase subunit delta [Candidatus Cytomitobacter primus]QEK38631.1 hypothetical protein FZC34_01775 [Candidatus Cytomitobacter primus]
MSLQHSVWSNVPVDRISDLTADILKIYIFRKKENDTWNSIPILNLDLENTLNLSKISNDIISYVYNSCTWSDFNQFISMMYRQCSICKSNINNVQVILSKPDEELEQIVRKFIVDQFENDVNIIFKYKISILGGVMIDIGSIRIDASYGNMLNKFIGELHESFKA